MAGRLSGDSPEMRRELFVGLSQTRIWIVASIVLSGSSAAIADPAPWDLFMASLIGPWGKAIATSGPAPGGAADKAGKAAASRAPCPEPGLASPKDMIGDEVWFDRLKDGRFGSYSSRTPTRLGELTFIRLEGADTAVFYFAAPKGTQGTMSINRIGPDRIVVAVSAAGTTTETYYNRCRRLP